MTNQDAIYILSGLRKSLHEYCGLNDNAHKAFDMAISALQAQELKQEVKNSNESSLTQKALDTISRQAAIDAIRRAMCEDGFRTETGLLHEDTACEAIKALPSAQPEIIMCKDCVCGHGEVWLFGNGGATAYGYCGRTHLQVLPYDYCSWAERKTNGSD